MTVTILIDRIKVPVYNIVTANTIEERELVFESSSNSLVAKVNGQLIKIPYEPAIVNALWQELENYIEQNSILIPTTQPSDPEEGSVYFNVTDNKLYIYIDSEWLPVTQ